MKSILSGIVLALASSIAFAGPVNINTADAKTLSKELTGIGPAKAEAIVKYRAEKGAFTSAEQLKNVVGIGDAVFEKNKANIRVKD